MQIIYNGQPRELGAATKTIADLVGDLGLRPQLVAVEVNGDLAPRARHSMYVLSEGDRVEIVTLVGGG
jgi:thiamine biosynthesis protein ThiS